jgi:hypothetical protein
MGYKMWKRGFPSSIIRRKLTKEAMLNIRINTSLTNHKFGN